jgi:hypothetical protein
MLRATVLFGLVSLVTVRAIGADVAGPAQLPASRYAAMSGKSPFALATPPEPTSAASGTFASNWFVSGIGRYGDNAFVTIKSRDLSVQFTLFGPEAHPEYHVSLASVNWSDTIGQSTVVLQKGTETAKLEFNQALLRTTQPAADSPPAGATTGDSASAPAGAGNASTPATSLSKTALAATSAAKTRNVAIVSAQPGRQFPTTSRSSGAIQRRIQIIAQPR